MDPLSALSIATSVVQFVQFGGSLVSKSCQLYRQGVLVDHAECENAIKRLSELTENLNTPLRGLETSSPLSPDSQALEDICSNCTRLSKELLLRLDKLRVDEKHRLRKWKSFRQALKSVCSKDGVDDLARRIADCREELNSHLIVSIREKTDTLALRQYEAVVTLTESHQKTFDTLLDTRDQLKKDLLDHSDHIIQASLDNYAEAQESIKLTLRDMQSIETYMMESLRFNTMDHRGEEIHEAHARTFKWIFNEFQEQNCMWSNFVGWLKEGSGVYWVSGKAGSGKSTLMRYIFNHPMTLQFLRAWADGLDLDVSGFFFWNSGSREQRSQAGLFRSLLYQALKKRPDLVRHVFPDEWTAYSLELEQKKRFTDYSWPLIALKAGFKRWVALAPTSSRLCFFIDGLDEYEGDHEEIAELFKAVSSTTLPHVKVCVSSRPWVVFDDAFGGSPGLRLQDLTYSDIEAYVEDKLQANHKMQLLATSDSRLAKNLVNEIVTKASGVFLWVQIVVKSLLTGLRNQDGIDDLRKRLEDLPSDLSALYTHMVDHIEPLYREQACYTFLIYRNLAEEEYESSTVVTALQLYLAIVATSQQSMTGDWTSMKSAEIRLKYEHLDIHLKSRCAGLLEMCQPPDKNSKSSLYFHNRKMEKVGYLHRTVKEFLETGHGQAIIRTSIKPSFDPNLRTIMSYVTMVRRSVLITKDGKAVSPFNADIWRSISSAMKYAKAADQAGNRDYIAIIDELGYAGFRMWHRDVDPWDPHGFDAFHRNPGDQWATCDQPRTWRRNFLGKAVYHDLCSYIQSKVELEPSIISTRQETPLLNYALLRHQYASVNMIELLLKLGGDPNQLWFGNTPWQHALTQAHMVSFNHAMLQRWTFIFKLMLHYGASPYTTCTHNHDMRFPIYNITPPHSVDAVITDTFQSSLSSEIPKLRHLLAVQVALHPPYIDSEDLRIMQSEALVQYIMHGLASYRHCTSRTGLELGTSRQWKSELSPGYDHEMTEYPEPIRPLDHDLSTRISGPVPQNIPRPIMSSYDFLPPIVQSTIDTLGIFDA